jgi:uncharacterized damage-inducible protein DinB
LEKPMTHLDETKLELPSGYRSSVPARYVWQLDDQTSRLFEALKGATADELSWQPAPGTNTIGMLLAHLAIAEAHMAAIGVEGRPESDVVALLGITVDDDGLPLPEDGAPPAVLNGKDLAWFRGLVDKARAETVRISKQVTDADLSRRIVRPPRPDGTQRAFNVEWMLYHLVEHFCGHSGQILMLRHLYRARQPV